MTLNNSSSHDEKPADLAKLQAALLEWFARQARDLPWRQTRDPYRIMVSEIMLQQTQVERVLPKYQAFLEMFPTIEALAAAPTAEVIRMWAGLGYNRRAVNMQRAAQAVLAEHGGRFPQDMALLLRLPGIGPYTAGAIACFAFEQDVAFMDTNIRRVVQRLFVGPEEAGAASEAELLAVALAAVPEGQGWTWNQAAIELGALICTATAPACWRCPVQAYCKALAARRAADEQIFDGKQPPTPRQQRRVAERREAPYSGSSRFYRGRIVDALRRLPPSHGIGLEELGAQVKQHFAADDMPWLRTLVEALARDGLLVLEDDSARLP
jgi:A/G-specific adenine glycosylase